MANRSIRPTRRMLRAAGLLPPNEPRHHVAAGQEVPPQPEIVSQVFGSAEIVGSPTQIPVFSVWSTSETTGSITDRKRVAVVEVTDGGVTLRRQQPNMRMWVTAILALAWNVFWLVRALRR